MQERHNFGVSAGNVYIYSHDSSNHTSCYYDGTTSGGTGYISGTSTATTSGYETLTFNSQLDSGNSHDWAGIEIRCSLSHTGSSILGEYTTLQ